MAGVRRGTSEFSLGSQYVGSTDLKQLAYKVDASTLVRYVLPWQAISKNQESLDDKSGECQNGTSG
ncbi:MAG: hypothetical protein V7K21_02025 [Nostoc sp.]|uniref:hypothetical protein n=1 Tax=Nostoc sp. TaxID=1180 RepID=UPI002FF680DF